MSVGPIAGRVHCVNSWQGVIHDFRLGGETAPHGSKKHGLLWGLGAKEQNRRIELYFLVYTA